MRRAVIAPHCDDEAMGCGGLLAKYPDETFVIVMARPDETRAAEFALARETLGYTESLCLDLPDGNVGADMAGVVSILDAILAKFQPDEVYLPFPSMHQDHIATYEAGMRSVRLSMATNHWYPQSVFVYDVAAYDVPLYPSDLRWNVFETLTTEHVYKKAGACSAYESQVPAGMHPINGVWEAAAALGHARRQEYVEQYALVRSVR